MKLTRWLLLGFGLVALLVAGLVTAVFLPSVQKWAVLRAVSGQPGIRLSLGTVSAGLSSFHLTQVEFAKDGLVVKADDISGDYALWPIVTSRHVSLGRLAIHGVNVDLTGQTAVKAAAASPAAAPAVAAAAPAAFAGVFAGLELPLDIELGKCEIAGRARLPGPPGRAAIDVEYNLTGGQFGPGREASFLVNARLTNPQPKALSTLQVNATLQVALTAQRVFRSFGLSAVIDAEGPALTEKTQLRIESHLAQPAAGRENYSAKIDTVSGGIATTVVDVRAEFDAAAKTIGGTWSLKANRTQLEPFLLGVALPEFGANGYGRFRFETDSQRVTLGGCHFSGVVDHLGTLVPVLESVGAISLQADFDAAFGGQTARLDRLDLVLSGQRPVLEVRTSRPLQVDLAKRTFHFDGGPGEVLRLKLLGVPVAWARPFVSAVAIADGSLTGDVSLFAEGDNLRAQSTVPLKIEGLEFGGPTPPLPGKMDIGFAFEALATPEKIQASVREFRIATSTGDTVTAQADISVPAGASPAIGVKFQFDADLPKLLAAQLPVNGLRVKGEADATLQGKRLDIRTFGADLAANGTPLFTVSALQAFSFDLEKRRATPTDTSKPDLMRVVLGQVPLAPFAKTGDLLAFGGRIVQGEFLFAVDGDKILLRSPSPLKLTGLSLAQPGRPLLTQLAIELTPTAEITTERLDIRTGTFTLRNAAGATLLTAQTEATLVPGKESRIESTFQIDIPPLAAQPVFAAASIVSQGRMGGEVRAVLTESGVQVEARTTLNGLVARNSGQPLPVANLNLRTVIAADGSMTVQVPILLDNGGQRSDLNLAATVKPVGDTYTFDAQVTSNHLDVDDARAVLGVFSTAAQPEEAAPAAPAAHAAPAAAPAALAADIKPVWSRVAGLVVLDVKSVTYGKDWAMTGLTGSLKIDAEHLTLQKLAATFNGKSPLEISGGLQFVAKSERPYRLDGQLALNDFDAGKLFRALEATKTPTVEGMFTVSGKVAGDGANLAELGERAHGQFEMTSRQGIFRGLARTTAKVSTATKAVQFGAALGALLGSDTVAKSAEKVAGSAYFVDELATGLGEFTYDQLSVKLSRDEGLNVKLDSVSLISQEVRLVGSGTVTHAVGVPLLQQPLAVELTLAGRGKIEQMLGKLGALDGARDDLGYARMKFPVTIGGTLEKPDPSKFYTAFATSGILNLLGR